MPEVLERGRLVQPSVTTYRGYSYGPISWSGLIAGSITFLSLQLMFTVLGIGIGAASMDVFTRGNPLAGLGIGGGIWFLITGLVALFLAGMVCSRVAGLQFKPESLMHGFLTWCLVTVVSVYLGAMVLSGLSTGLGAGAGEAVGEAADGGAPVVQRFEGGRSPQPAGDEDTMHETEIPMTDRFEGQRGTARPPEQRPAGTEVRQTAETAREGTAITGIGSGIALLLGALAATLGGFFGRSNYGRVEYERTTVR